jgi:hypothetical protein
LIQSGRNDVKNVLTVFAGTAEGFVRSTPEAADQALIAEPAIFKRSGERLNHLGVNVISAKLV